MVSYGEWAGERQTEWGCGARPRSLLGVCTRVGGKHTARNPGYSRSREGSILGSGGLSWEWSEGRCKPRGSLRLGGGPGRKERGRGQRR